MENEDIPAEQEEQPAGFNLIITGQLCSVEVTPCMHAFACYRSQP
jgi:hypothetical protein